MKQLITLSILFISLTSDAQPVKTIHNRSQTWFGYLNQTRFTRYWGLWLDVHERLAFPLERQSQLLIRPGLTCFINDNLRITAGYTYVSHFPEKGHTALREEHRPWQQLWYRNNFTRLQTLQWLRLEQRYIQKTLNDVILPGYTFNYRVRYNVFFGVPLTGKKLEKGTVFFILQDELFINFGKDVLYNHFDQNRFFSGIGYYFNNHLNLQAGYMNIFQQTAGGNVFNKTHSLRLFLFHNLDFRKPDTR